MTQILFQVERQERKEKELQKQKSAGGWFSSWFGGSTQVKEEETLTAAAIGQSLIYLLMIIYIGNEKI
jgi:hypothetical protein